MNEGGVNFGLPALLLERRPQFLDTDIRQRRKRIANFSRTKRQRPPGDLGHRGWPC